MHICPPAVVLFQQGEPAGQVYLIRRGLVKLLRMEEGGQEMIVALRRPGWFLGAAAVILGEPYPVSATTVTRSHFSHLSADQFRRLLKDDLSFSWQLHQMHSSEVYSQTIRFAEMGGLRARKRLRQLLWEFAANQATQERPGAGRDIRLEIPLKHWELAQLLAITPVYLSRLLQQMEEEGLIRRSKGWLIIPRIGALWNEIPRRRAAGKPAGSLPLGLLG